MNKVRLIHLFESFLYMCILAVALGIPFFSGAYAYGGWQIVFFDWIRFVPFMFVFLANNYILVSRLLFRGKYLYYILACILLVLAAVYLSEYLFGLSRSIQPSFERMQNLRIPPEGMDFPPKDIPFPPFNRIDPQFNGKFPSARPFHYLFNFGLAIVSLLLIGFNTAIKLFVSWNKDRMQQEEKDRHHILTELAYLKHQISPHFFMNTLNNIHALVDINTEEAKEAIIKLSRLMRYLLYESDVQKVALTNEILFMESYVELMRLRYDKENLVVNTEYPSSAESVFVPPFLFLPYIENAFKHGIHANALSFIEIKLYIDGDWLTFEINNNKTGYIAPIDEASGIGLENARKRLDLIFEGKYLLDITSTEDKYKVILKIPFKT